MSNMVWIIVFALVTIQCTGSGVHDSQAGAVDLPVDDREFNTIAFGSCSRTDLAQPLWNDIVARNPDLWIWTGDIMYGDSEDMSVLKAKYDAQSEKSVYQNLTGQCPVIGIWDDHDYGMNNAGKEYGPKDESKALLFDFLGVPENDPSRPRAGAYQSYVYGEKNQQVKILLLDCRYFRDTPTTKNGLYVPNPTGTILGQEQWTWLEDELGDTEISLFIIISGIQILPTQHRFEKWANFPNERQRLIDMIVARNPKAALLVSGDRHIGEISVLEVPGLPYPLVDVTSSGLTHAYTGNDFEQNDLRHGELVNKLNFGVLQLDWSQNPPNVRVEIRGDRDALYESMDIEF